MTEREKEKLLAYLVNEMIRRENEVTDRRNSYMRYENYEIYCFELMSALIRLKAFQQFARDVMELMGL